MRRPGAAGLTLCAALCVPASAAAWQIAPTPWTYSLPRAATTSAGVYTSGGGLLRTLWRAEPRAAGRHDETWDGRDDGGAPVAASKVEIRLLHHRIRHVWEGVVGNSSDTFEGAGVHRAFRAPTGLAIVGDRMVYVAGYNEAQPGVHGFRLASPQRDTLPFASIDPFVSYAMVAADASRLYWANGGGMAPTSFVAAFDLGTGKPARFAAGTAICLNRRAGSGQCYEAQQYGSVIDVGHEPARVATGLAVQRAGRLLAVAHGADHVVRLFDKTSGAAVSEIALPLVSGASNQAAFTPGGDLWVVSGRSVRRYADLERAPRMATEVSGLERPVALAASPGDEGVWVADGGASSQLKRFDGAGRPGEVIGTRGGYASDPRVDGGKLCFGIRAGQERTAMAVADDRTLWVIDTCNNRMLRFRIGGSAPAASDAQVAYLPASYAATVDHGAPRRVFANFLEFEVDVESPLAPGERSWKLVRNWLAGLPAALVDDHAFNGAFGGFASVETLANGRTYALLTAHGRQSIVELPASGPMQIVKTFGLPPTNATAKVLYENGELGYAVTGTQSQSALRLPLTGFDAAGRPVWADEPVLLARVPLTPGTPYYRGAFSGMPPRFPATAAGQVVFFDQSVRGNEGFHLGAASSDGAGWLWLASPSGPLDGKGSFQTAAIDGSLHYGGNAVWVQGRHIVYGYHGEFYKDLQNGAVGQANSFMHFDESGLFLGQFGVPSTRARSPAEAGVSGNAFSPTLVRANGRLYLYHNDESAHGGVHRWRIDGADDVREMRGSGAPGSSIAVR